MNSIFIDKLRRDFDIEIIHSTEPNAWKNTFDVNEFGNHKHPHIMSQNKAQIISN